MWLKGMTASSNNRVRAAWLHFLFQGFFCFLAKRMHSTLKEFEEEWVGILFGLTYPHPEEATQKVRHGHIGRGRRNFLGKPGSPMVCRFLTFSFWYELCGLTAVCFRMTLLLWTWQQQTKTISNPCAVLLKFSPSFLKNGFRSFTANRPLRASIVTLEPRGQKPTSSCRGEPDSSVSKMALHVCKASLPSDLAGNMVPRMSTNPSVDAASMGSE